MALTVHHAGWRGYATGVREEGTHDASEDSAVIFGLFNEKARLGVGRATLSQINGNRVTYSVSATSAVDQKPESVVLALTLPCEAYAGGKWTDAAGKTHKFPVKAKKSHFSSGKVTSVSISDASGTETFTLTFPVPVRCTMQDDRKWRIPTFTVRFGDNGKRSFMKGEKRTFECAISSPDGVATTVDRPVVIARGDEWIPVDFKKDVEPGSALDFSGMGLQDAPAGKYGWLKNAGGHFEFEGRPGVPQRFYGVNLCFDANFPEQKLADALVARLTRIGYNSLRIHHYESANGVIKDSPDRLSINQGRMRRLDYLLYRAMEKGIYVTTDLYTIRPVRWRDIGIDRDGVIHWQVYKNLVGVHPPAFENWKTFARNFLTHVNPYTGRRYADEPGMPLISLINEGQMMWCWEEVRREAPMKAAWKKWLSERRAAEPGFAKGLSEDAERVPTRDNAALAMFMADVESDLARREREFLRSIGVKALLTGHNCGPNFAAMASVREERYDYVDTHFYIDHPRYLARRSRLPSRLANVNPVLDEHLSLVGSSYVRHFSKPFCVTEWNFAAPGSYRGVGGLMVGAMGSLQEWDGMWRFSYAHCVDNLMNDKARPSYFDIGADPVGSATERAAVCLFLRGDLVPLQDRVALSVTSNSYKFANGLPTGVTPPWQDAAWQAQVGLAVAPTRIPAFPIVEQLEAKTPPVALAQNPHVRLDRKAGSFSVNTPRTVGGFTPSGALSIGPVEFNVGDVPATVWVSSLDGQPVEQSIRLLVTHITDVQADGNAYADAARTTLVRRGKYPSVMRNGSAKVAVALERPESYEVWALATTGRRIGRVPVSACDGKLSFSAAVKGTEGAQMFYEVICKENGGE